MKTIIAAVFLSILAAYGTVTFMDLGYKTSVSAPSETVYDRVVRTGTIRCGYIIWEPWFYKDLATDKFSGLAYELNEALAKVLELKIEWVEEVSLGQNVPALQAGRIDAVCGPESVLQGSVVKYLDVTHPFLYAAMDLFVRADDGRFDNDLSKINDPSVTVSVMDGDLSKFVAEERFSKAKTLEIPATAMPSSLLLNVTTKKADVTIIDGMMVQKFLSSNPGTLKKIPGAPSMGVYPVLMSINKGEGKLLTTLNEGIAYMSTQGITDQILDKYDPQGQYVLRVHKPY